MPLYAAVHNPYLATLAVKQKLRWADQEEIDRITRELKRLGHDGALLENGDGSFELVAFDNTAVKSAIGNRGTFDPASSDVRFSRSGTAPSISAAASPTPSPLRDRMDRIVDSLIYNFQDRFKPLRDIQKRLVPATEDEDAVPAEERYSGIVRARTGDLHQTIGLGTGIGDRSVSRFRWQHVEDSLRAKCTFKEKASRYVPNVRSAASHP